MSRYATRSDLTGGYWDWADVRTPECLTVYEEDASPKNSGILNASGEALYALPGKKCIGFIHHD